MKKLTLSFLVILLGLSAAFTVPADAHHRYAVKEYKSLKIEATPFADLSAFGMNMPASASFSGILLVPKTAPLGLVPLLRDGGDDDGDDTSDDDTVGDGDHHHDGDTVGDDDHDGDHDGDTSDVGDDGGDDDNDTIDVGDGDHGDDHDGADDDNDTTDANDTGDHAFFGGSAQSITFRTHTKYSNVSMQFKNNLSASVKITNVALASGMNFAIVSGAPTQMHPATLAPGARLMLTIRYTATDKNVHSDNLVVSSNSSTALNTISLHGQQMPASRVSGELPQGVTIGVTPNPMSSYLKVSLDGARNARVEIFDVSGKQVVSANVSLTQWLWDGMSTSGTTMLSGTYFVRLWGESTNGVPFTASRKIVLQR